ALDPAERDARRLCRRGTAERPSDFSAAGWSDDDLLDDELQDESQEDARRAEDDDPPEDRSRSAASGRRQRRAVIDAEASEGEARRDSDQMRRDSSAAFRAEAAREDDPGQKDEECNEEIGEHRLGGAPVSREEPPKRPRNQCRSGGAHPSAPVGRATIRKWRAKAEGHAASRARWRPRISPGMRLDGVRVQSASRLSIE